MNKREFCERFVYLKGEPITFDGRPYLCAPYLSASRRLVIRASRQVEKSTFLVNTILYYAYLYPRIHILFACPRREQAQVFSNSRLLPALRESPLLRRSLLGRKLKVMNMQLANGSEVYIRAAFHSADAARGIDADVLLVDEFQDIADGHLPVLEETLSHSALRHVILTGTPKSVDNHLEDAFARSTACEYRIPCPGCARSVRLDERCLARDGPMCPDCEEAIEPCTGTWVAMNPESTWGEGYWINHLMVPWVDYEEIVERYLTYDPGRFKNECLGLPSLLGDHVVTRAELEACCTARPMAESASDVPPEAWERLVAGIDWGGGVRSRTVVVIGYLDMNNRFVLVHLARIGASEEPDVVLGEVAARCMRFRVSRLAADGGGNGQVYNRLLLDRLAGAHAPGDQALYAIHYSAAGHVPQQDGALFRWTIGRSASIGTVFSRIKKRTLLFPTLEDCEPFLDEFACEVAEYDDDQRAIRYTHPETQPDDALHATNYALQLACYATSRWEDDGV